MDVKMDSLKDEKLEDVSGGAIIESEELFYVGEPESLWETITYGPQINGGKTGTTLNVNTPLRAGQHKIRKCWIGEDGEINVNHDN